MEEIPAMWWSKELDGFLAEHRTESGDYELIQHDDEGWYVAQEQEIDLPSDAVRCGTTRTSST